MHKSNIHEHSDRVKKLPASGEMGAELTEKQKIVGLLFKIVGEDA